jgi:predicted amidohydrolase YtcJ
MKQILVLLLTLAAFTTTSSQISRGEKADMILHHGFIWTVDDKNPIVEAVAIKDGKFAVVGSNAAALKLRGLKTEVINLRGTFVVPADLAVLSQNLLKMPPKEIPNTRVFWPIVGGKIVYQMPVTIM